MQQNIVSLSNCERFWPINNILITLTTVKLWNDKVIFLTSFNHLHNWFKETWWQFQYPVKLVTVKTELNMLVRAFLEKQAFIDSNYSKNDIFNFVYIAILITQSYNEFSFKSLTFTYQNSNSQIVKFVQNICTKT